MLQLFPYQWYTTNYISMNVGRSSEKLTLLPPRSAYVSDPGPFFHKHSLYRSATKIQRKSVAIYSPSQIYPLQSLPISFSPWAANYRETSTTSWAVICGAAVPHPLDLLSLSPPETASVSTINSSIFLCPTCECQPPFSSFFFFSLHPLAPVMIYTVLPE